MNATVDTVRKPGTGAANESAGERLVSLDAFRGLVMLAMASAGLGISQVAKATGDTPWTTIAVQLDHVPWVGCVVWDLIQPAFMFMVGVAIPYSYGKRAERGDSPGSMFRHALARSFLLVALSVFLVSAWSERTNFLFTNVLAQIGLGYLFVVLLQGRGAAAQAAMAAAILAGYWLAFYLYPAPQPGVDMSREAYNQAFAVSDDWPLLTGLASHWNKNANFAGWFDTWFLNLFPREKTWTLADNEGGYHTLNFIPSIATMLFGLMAGELLRSARSRRAKILTLVVAGGLLLAGGWLAGETICPIVKRIWTPSWALFSGGIVVWILAAFYLVVDVAGLRRWTLPLVVVGMNSITMYVMAQLMKGWTWEQLGIHLGPLVAWSPIHSTIAALLGPGVFDPVYEPIVRLTSVFVVFWLICAWLYRQRLFVRI
jgi:predicted acyltransferase